MLMIRFKIIFICLLLFYQSQIMRLLTSTISILGSFKGFGGVVGLWEETE